MQWCETSYLCAGGCQSVYTPRSSTAVKEVASELGPSSSGPCEVNPSPLPFGAAAPGAASDPTRSLQYQQRHSARARAIPARPGASPPGGRRITSDTRRNYLQIYTTGSLRGPFTALRATTKTKKKDNSRAQMGMVCLVSPRPAFRQDSLLVIVTGLQGCVPLLRTRRGGA